MVGLRIGTTILNCLSPRKHERVGWPGEFDLR